MVISETNITSFYVFSDCFIIVTAPISLLKSRLTFGGNYLENKISK